MPPPTREGAPAAAVRGLFSVAPEKLLAPPRCDDNPLVTPVARVMRTRRASTPPVGLAARFRHLWQEVFVALALACAVVPAAAAPLAAGDEALLDAVQRRAVAYFAEQSDARTGFARDRAPLDGGRSAAPSSVAATGFALTAWVIADRHGWLPPGEARRRTRDTLHALATRHAHARGWFYHFVDPATGARVWDSEASTIDTALLLKGALLAREHFRDAEIAALADALYARIDWRWALDGGRTLSHGWRPESGFIPHRWDSYAEILGLYLLGLGAPRGALPPETWQAWRREPRVQTADGRTFIQCGPLFTHQYAHAWFDFRGRRDAHADYWQNSVDATLAQRTWSAAQSGRFRHWSRDLWGLTASDGPRGYMAWGTPGPWADEADGTLVPCAPGGSLPFAPRECLTALQAMRDVGGARVWGRYGFADAFNPQTGWVSPDVIGINVGIMLVMAENLRSGAVWQTFMRAPEVQRGLRLAGFVRTEDADKRVFLATVAP